MKASFNVGSHCMCANVSVGQLNFSIIEFGFGWRKDKYQIESCARVSQSQKQVQGTGRGAETEDHSLTEEPQGVPFSLQRDWPPKSRNNGGLGDRLGRRP